MTAIFDNMIEPWGHKANWNKPLTAGQKLSDSTYMRYLKQSNSQKQKVEWQMARAQKEWGVACQWVQTSLMQDEEVLKRLNVQHYPSF